MPIVLISVLEKDGLKGVWSPSMSREAGQPLMTVGLFTRDKDSSFLSSRKATLSVVRSQSCCSIPFRHVGRMQKDNPLML